MEHMGKFGWMFIKLLEADSKFPINEQWAVISWEKRLMFFSMTGLSELY